MHTMHQAQLASAVTPPTPDQSGTGWRTRPLSLRHVHNVAPASALGYVRIGVDSALPCAPASAASPHCLRPLAAALASDAWASTWPQAHHRVPALAGSACL